MHFVFIILLVPAIVILAGVALWTSQKKVVDAVTKEDQMADTFQRISYVALIILMFGICTGFLGAG